MIKILMIDENPENITRAQTLLKNYGDYSVRGVSSPKEASGLLGEDYFDVIISEYEMSGIDAISFLKSVKDKIPTIPFLFFSKKGREEVVLEVFRSGADGYVQKGTRPQACFAELSHQIEVAVSKSRVEEELLTKEYAIENSINGAVIADYETGRFIYANAMALRMLGYGREEITSIKVQSLLSGPSRDEIYRLILGSLEEKDYYIGEFRVKRRDGSEFFASASITNLYRDRRSRKMLFISFIDVTEKVQSEEEFLTFVLEASRRIREPVILLRRYLEDIASDVDKGADPDDFRMRILVLIKNAQQIIKNLNDLNQAVTETHETISEEYKKFLTR